MDAPMNKKESEKLKKIIIAMFAANVRGKKPDTSTAHKKHAGKEGHWLETQMGVSHNASNSPDLHGFEMKNDTTSKTTFGDWSADYYIFKKDSGYKITRDTFLKIFGKPNKNKKGRYSWSGEPCPKIGSYNSFGQTMIIDRNNNIIALYNFSKDKRRDKMKIVPKVMQKDDLILAKWSVKSMKSKVEKKFNKRGWFKCLKNDDGVYHKIVFGEPITFKNWIKGAKKGLIFFDSGMYQGNARNYSQWRANNKYWEILVTSTY